MLALGASAKGSCTWLSVELLGRFQGEQTLQDCPIKPETLAQLVLCIDSQRISGKAGKEILDALMTQTSANPKDIDVLIDKLGLAQVGDENTLLKAIAEVLESNTDKVAEYKSGKEKLFGFFVGQVLKKLKNANPSLVNSLLKQELNK